MGAPTNTTVIFALLSTFCWSNSAYSRQNIVIGEISTGYDFVEREYDDSDDEVANDVTIPLDQDAATSLSGVTDTEAVEGFNESNEGDTRRWFITPRIRVSSQGINDLLEFTYAPTFPFLSDDEYDNDENIGHDLNLLAEKSFTRNWSLHLSDSYYYGDDSIEDTALSSSDIIPGTDSEEEQTVGAEQTDETSQSLNEKNDGNEYWRNTLNIGTDYTYTQDSVIGFDYTFEALRNINDDDNGYQDYDRHQGTGSLSYRFNRSWNVETQVGYVKGIYEPTEITYIQPEIIQVAIEDETVESDVDITDDDEEAEIEYEDQTVYNQSEEEVSDDLEEYNFLFRTNYDWRIHDRLFSLYSYDATDYESALREDAAIHDITLGWSHDFNRAVSITLSGGPSFVTYEERSTDTGYNAQVGLTWNFQHAALAANSSYGYDFDNFDGDRTGLSQTWQSTLSYSYQFSPRLSLSLSSGYERSDNEEPIATTVLLDLDGEDTANDDIIEYTEETYDAGLSLSYNFLQWYTVSATYRYANYRSENDLDYDEHRVYLTLSASKELFRW